jgi:hypothetical protein
MNFLKTFGKAYAKLKYFHWLENFIKEKTNLSNPSTPEVRTSATDIFWK